MYSFWVRTSKLIEASGYRCLIAQNWEAPKNKPPGRPSGMMSRLFGAFNASATEKAGCWSSALAEADISIAMADGSDVAIEAADIALMNGQVGGVRTAIDLSRHTIRIIRANLFWAFAYNTAGIPLAAGVLYPFFGILLDPRVAAFAMVLSSVSVLANSLRLRTMKI